MTLRFEVLLAQTRSFLLAGPHFCFFSSSTRINTGRYPRRPSGQGHGRRCLASPVRCFPSFLSRVGFIQHPHFSAFYDCRFSSDFGNSRFRAFRSPICTREKKSLVRCEPTLTLASIVTRIATGPPGTPAYCILYTSIDYQVPGYMPTI